MDKTFTKALFVLLLPLLVITAARAQTITAGAVDPGPYGKGSSITLPFHIDNTTGCVAKNNTFKLILSDATGNFSSPLAVVLSTKTGFYETFANGVIPSNTPAGTGYRLRIQLSSPNISATSAAFTISDDPAVIAAVTSQSINSNYPDVFGSCVTDTRHPPPPYRFENGSTAGATVTAVFFNELSQTGTAAKPIPVNFSADFTNYTIIVKAEKGGIVGTRSYTLINNTLFSAFGGATSTTVCLGSATPLTYAIPLSDDTTGKQQSFKYNYPGLIYNIKWGDGASNDLTFCEISAAQGKLSHVYNKSSCGNKVGTQRNVFQVDFLPTNPYCGSLGTPFTGYAKVLTQPTNLFTFPANACTNTPVTFNNISDPGQDPDNTGPECKNADARYTWTVTAEDGTVLKTSPSMKREENFVYTFPLHGTYTITLHLINSNGLCDAVDLSQTICIADKAKPDFTIPPIICLSDGPVTPVDNSVVDNTPCNTTPPSYNWKLVSGPANGVTFNATAKLPQFNFNKIGIYKFQLEISASSCGPQLSPIKTIVVNAEPTATLSNDAILCGKGQTLIFDPNVAATKTILDGTAETQATTYTWTVTSPDGGTFSFAPGSTANSQYPHIVFNDYATYNISVTHTNNCGTVTKTQQLQFVVAPTVVAGTYTAVCQGSPIVLSGSPGVGGQVTGVSWKTTTGGTFTNQNSPNATYTPSAADIAAGQVTLSYQATTSLTAPCNLITDQTTILIIKTATVTSTPTPPPVCSGGTFNYTITSADPATTFTWTAAATTGTATGFTTPGSGNTINDVLSTNDNTDAIVTYTITPTLNGCQGTPFSLKVTVHPLPVITAVPVASPICSNEPANITLTSNINPTTYTWTAVATNGITGATNHPTATTVASIQDVLVNNSGVQGTVTYTITPYNGTCPGTPVPVIITVNPAPVKADAGSDQPVFICPGTYQLQGNNPSPGTGEWLPVAGITFSDKNSPNAIASGLLPGQTYHFTWSITAAVPGCPPSTDEVTVTRNLAAVGGITATTTPTVCAGTDVTVTLTGQIGNIVWQRSTDGGTNWIDIPGQTTATLNFPAITQTSLFRAAVTSGACGVDNSTVTTITVIPPPPAADAGTYPLLCNRTFVDLVAKDPGSFTGKWEQVDGPTTNVVIATPNNFSTRVDGLTPGNTYKFQWTIFAKAPCTGNTSAVATIVNGADVTPEFTAITQVCGPQEVIFNNTSADAPGTTYLWDFGDGETSTMKNPTHKFEPNTDGTDIKRTVSLTVTNSCGSHLPKTQDITISPAVPDAEIAPSTTQSCGQLLLTVKNNSKGNNFKYDFYLVDEHDAIIQQLPSKFDKSDAVFDPIDPTNTAAWHVYMIVTDNCGHTNRSNVPQINVSPSDVKAIMNVKDNRQYVCLGSPVIFENASAGATIFYYRFYDETGNFLYEKQAGLTDYSYTFPNIGKYFVSIKASNPNCNGSESDKYLHPIEVVPLPQPEFTFTTDVNGNVTFVNKTPDAGATPATSLNYQWNFGDGSAVDNSYTPAKHFYSYEKSPYTVSLTATAPGNNCSNIKTHTIEIKFTGELFLPNAFQPAASSTELRTFKAKGQKLKEWRMQIFNNWGQLVWQTTALNSNGEPTEGWDGTFKGAPAPQGTYVWQITARFLNGSDWRGMSYNGSLPNRSGVIHLIR